MHALDTLTGAGFSTSFNKIQPDGGMGVVTALGQTPAVSQDDCRFGQDRAYTKGTTVGSN
jgi:hypothetical protein